MDHSRARAVGRLVGSLPAVPVFRETARNKPTSQSSILSEDQLTDAFDRHVDDIKPGASVNYDPYHNTPEGNNFLERFMNVLRKPSQYAGSNKPGDKPAIAINPNADLSLYAHEMGHLASQQTDVGNLAANLRYNPALQKALYGAMLTLPGITAAAMPGDEDMDEALAVAALAAAPTMIDEGLATKHGLAIMDKAGLRADLGQRGRLAGGLLSYMAPSVMAAVGGNVVGNMLDENTGEAEL